MYHTLLKREATDNHEQRRAVVMLRMQRFLEMPGGTQDEREAFKEWVVGPTHPHCAHTLNPESSRHTLTKSRRKPVLV